MFRGPRWLLGIVATSAALLPGCADGGGGEATPAPSSISVPVPVEDVTLTGAVGRILGLHALELGDAPTLVIVLEGVPPSVRPGSEVQATGSVDVFREGLGAELGIPLDDLSTERFEGVECLVVARLEVLGPL